MDYSNKNYLISLTRVIAMLMIIFCHFGTAYNNSAVGQFFQVGVQVFLLISGLLFGEKKIINIKEWLLNRIKRVSIPCYVYLPIMIIVSLLLNLEISIPMIILIILNLQGYRHIFTFIPELGSVPGMAHLWFITAIFGCYLLIALINKFGIQSRIKQSRKWVLITFGLVCVISGFWGLRLDYFWAFAYGYLFSAIINEKITQKTTIIAVVFCMIAIVLRLGGKYFFDAVGDTNVYLCIIIPCAYNMLAVSGFYILKALYENLLSKFFESERAKKMLLAFDGMSFYVYITHYTFIDGPVSMMRITRFSIINCLLAVIATTITGGILKLTSDWISKKINR